MSKSKISWTEQTWNPIVGCSIISPGCKNCYAMKMANRICGMNPDSHYQGTVKTVNGKPVWTGKLVKAPESVLTKPLKRKKPTMYFVNSMSDLFHEDVPYAWIDEVFAVMALCPQHTYQILTKRAERMAAYIATRDAHMLDPIHKAMHKIDPDAVRYDWPLPNVWLGVSAEDQKQADIRIPHLINTPAKLRFLSLEPQLEEISLTSPKWRGTFCNTTDWLDDIQLVIQGGESGHNARNFKMDWARSIRDQCYNHTDMGRPWPRKYFLKQTIDQHGKLDRSQMLDGVKHDAMPEVG